MPQVVRWSHGAAVVRSRPFAKVRPECSSASEPRSPSRPPSRTWNPAPGIRHCCGPMRRRSMAGLRRADPRTHSVGSGGVSRGGRVGGIACLAARRLRRSKARPTVCRSPGVCRRRFPVDRAQVRDLRRERRDRHPYGARAERLRARRARGDDHLAGAGLRTHDHGAPVRAGVSHAPLSVAVVGARRLRLSHQRCLRHSRDRSRVARGAAVAIAPSARRRGGRPGTACWRRRSIRWD